MKRGITILLSLCVLVAAAYFTASKWAIRHQMLTFTDPARDNRLVAVDIAVRRDKELQANAGMIKLPVAILNHGNTVKFTEYSFLANLFAARGYLVVSIQHDLPTDAPMVTKVGELYVGRQPQYERDIANIRFAIDEMKQVQTNADYDHLTMVGHSMGADVSLSGKQPTLGGYFREAWIFGGHLCRIVAVLGAVYLAWRSQQPRRQRPAEPWKKQRFN